MNDEPKNEVAKLDMLADLPQKYDDSAFDAATKSGKYLPRLELKTSNSEKCKDGSFPINHYALVRDQHMKDLGKDVDCAIIAWRPKAVNFGEMVIAVFDHEDPQFKKIEDDAEVNSQGNQYGVEFLVWLPEVKEFATFFMGSKTARRESPVVKALLGQAATLKSHKIPHKKYDYFGPTATSCSTPFEMPDRAELLEVVEKFNNPPKTEIEQEDESSGDDRAR